jgi:hypothetical protein
MPANGQYDYPQNPWSEGNMRMAKRAFPSDPGYPIRELEGQKKKRETRVSQFDFSTMDDDELMGHMDSIRAELDKRNGATK